MNFTTLDCIGDVSLGYKSLQNDFFYVDRETVETYGIEARFLKPLFRLRDMEPDAFVQTAKPRMWLFHCLKDENDLRGTGAYRYIHTMGSRGAARRKQAGAPQTIREALKAQGGSRWYARKAVPKRHRFWIRKAFDGRYAPFVFNKRVLVDQRCNAIEPVAEVPAETLGALLTSTLFAYGVEINGSASLGGGALEAPTRQLRGYPIFDGRVLDGREHQELQRLVKAVWESEEPIDWRDGGARPGQHMRRLDEWLLGRAGSTVSVDVVYRDLGEVCRARIAVGGARVGATKKRQSESVGEVARGVAEGVRRLLELRRFPEDFMDAEDERAATLVLPRDGALRIEIGRVMNLAGLRVALEDGSVVYEEASIPWAVGEVIVRACLLGRREFAVSMDGAVAEGALGKFRKWFGEVDEQLGKAIAESTRGTGYEGQLRREVYRQLDLHPAAGEEPLPQVINVPGVREQ